MNLLFRLIPRASLLASFIAIASAVEFGPAQQIANVVSNPQQIAAVDMDGDGDLDLVAVESSGHTVVVWENTGKGVYKRGRDWQSTVFAFHVADFDGDGRPDILATIATSSFAPTQFAGLELFRGDGAGGFSTDPVPLLPLGSISGQLAVHDLNHDGIPDILSAGAVYLNDGHGHLTEIAATLPPEAVRGTGINSGSMVWIDENGDGYDDLFFRDLKGAVQLALNQGNGTFKIQPTGLILPSSGPVAAMRLPGVSASPALVVSGFNGLQLYVKGETGYVPVAELSTPTSGGRPSSSAVWPVSDGSNLRVFVSFTDSNKDGLPVRDRLAELVIRATGKKAAMSLRFLSGSFSAQRFSPVLADLDGDGVSDIAVSQLAEFGYTASMDQITWRRGSKRGVFSGKSVTVTDRDRSSIAGRRLLYAGDLNGDGQADLLTYSEGNGTAGNLSIWWNDGQARSFTRKDIAIPGTLSGSVSLEQPLGQASPVVTLFSIVYYSDRTSRSSQLQYSFTPTGRIRQKTLFRGPRLGHSSPMTENDGLSSEPVSPFAAGTPVDIDWDGDLDYWNTFFWWENNGTPDLIHHDTVQQSEVLINGQTVKVGFLDFAGIDFDGDDHPDYLNILNDADGEIKTIQPLFARAGGDPTATTYPFDPAALLSGTPSFRIDSAFTLTWLDLNTDGLPDALYRRLSDGKFVWKQNLGQGGFADEDELAPASIYDLNQSLLADLDGDGIPDLISCSGYFYGRIEWRKGR